MDVERRGLERAPRTALSSLPFFLTNRRHAGLLELAGRESQQQGGLADPGVADQEDLMMRERVWRAA